MMSDTEQLNVPCPNCGGEDPRPANKYRDSSVPSGHAKTLVRRQNICQNCGVIYDPTVAKEFVASL